ncbi:tachykinin-like peptides receptor 86C [Actinia tenebrosa]|uniref:Tachykinin-like peptides receptor 86C n=1 Tax=Actinia tenebrosa TaxID=6105 RepID=A0A6P8J552_ACTTE|nr:tachykinin-like peptides receptor 86C [Actinia tenebrosa]
MENSTFGSILENNTALCSPYTDPNWSRALKGGTYVLIMLVSVIGNSLVIYIISSAPSMRTTTNYLIANLAVADLFITCVSMPVVAMVNITGFNNFRSVVTAVIVCKINPLVHGSSMESAIFSLVAISFDRLFAIATPFKKVITFYRLKVILFCIWFFSLLTLSPLLYVIKFVQRNNFYYCYERWPESFDQEQAARAYTVILFLLFYAIPLLIMAVVYPIIIHKLWGRGKGITELLPTYMQRKRRTNRKVLKMLMTVVITFALCWLTFHVRMFLGFFGSTNNIPCALQPHLYFLAFSIAHSNSAITPLIYYFFNATFRNQFQKVFYKLFPRLSQLCGLKGAADDESNATQNISLVRFRSDAIASRQDALVGNDLRTKLGSHRPRKVRYSSPSQSSLQGNQHSL